MGFEQTSVHGVDVIHGAVNIVGGVGFEQTLVREVDAIHWAVNIVGGCTISTYHAKYFTYD